MDWTVRNDATQECGEFVLALLALVPTLAFASPMRPWPGRWKQHLVWEKGEHVSGGGDPGTYWKPSWELLQVRNTGTLNGPREGAVLRFLADKDDYALHPTPKPVALLCYLIEKVSRSRDTILDPFMGSGTTLVAAKRLGRRAIGIEIEEKYCEIAARRLQEASMPLLDGIVEPEQAQLLEWNAEIDRCDQEIAALESLPADINAKAVDVVMARNDWEHEKRLIGGKRP